MHKFDERSIYMILQQEGLINKPINEMSREQFLSVCSSVVDNYTPHEYSMPFLRQWDEDGSQTLVMTTETKKLLQEWFGPESKEVVFKVLTDLGATEKTMQNYGVLPRFKAAPHKASGLKPSMVLDLYPKFCERCCCSWDAPQGKCGNIGPCSFSHARVTEVMDEYIKEKGKW